MISYFSEYSFRGNHAGTKARNDIEQLLRQTGGRPINKRSHFLRVDESEDHIVSSIKTRLDFIPYFIDLLTLKAQTIIIQYPMLSFDLAEDYVDRIRKKNKVVFLVHDLHSLRRKDGIALEKEIAFLNKAYGVVLHNRFMEAKLRESGLSVERVYLLNCFDYLIQDYKKESSFIPGSIAFAGNLSKSVFLPKMVEANPSVRFDLYGPGWDGGMERFENAGFKGSFPPDELPEKMNEAFGLVWDGEGIAGCSGKLGEYITINNPHKLSLYIAAGIPIITWDRAAIAEFVSENRIGYLLSDLKDLACFVSSIDEEDYLSRCECVHAVREKVINGHYFKKVLSQIECEG